MMITNINMKNFKSWADTGDIRLAPLTGFFGTNSSGKTSLLQMLLLLKRTTDSADRNSVFHMDSEKDSQVDLGTVSDILHNGQNILKFGLSWSLPHQLSIPIPRSKRTLSIPSLTFETIVQADQGSKPHVEALTYSSTDFHASLTRRSADEYELNIKVSGKEPARPRARPMKYMTPFKSYGFSQEALRAYMAIDYLSDFVLEFEQLFRRVYYLGPLREYPRRVYAWTGAQPSGVGEKGDLAVAALLARGKDRPYSSGSGSRKYTIETRIAAWLKEMGMVESFRTVPIREGGTQYELRIRRSPNSAEVLITDMGFGVSQLLPVLVLCYYAPEGSTILLEQPEIHLHPSAQSWLADVFIDVVSRRNLQLIVESHSEHFLRRLQRRIADESFSAKDAALYFCEAESGTSTIQPLDIDMFGNIRNWPKDFFGDLTGDLLEMAQKGFERQLRNQ